MITTIMRDAHWSDVTTDGCSDARVRTDLLAGRAIGVSTQRNIFGLQLIACLLEDMDLPECGLKGR